MATIEYSISIARSVSDVYSAATAYDDPDAMKQWRSDIETIGITAGSPLRSGSMIAMTKHFNGSKIFINFDILDLQRNKYVKLQGMHGRFPYTREIDFGVNGRETNVKDVIVVNTSWLFFWYAPLLSRALEAQIKREWETLKRQLEAQG